MTDNRYGWWISLGLILTMAIPLHAGDIVKNRLDAGMPYQAERRNPVVHDVDFSVVITPPYHCKLLKVWLPLPKSDEAQQLIKSSLSTFPDEVSPKIATEPVYGNKFAYWEFRNPKGAQQIRHCFRVKVWELRWGLNPLKVRNVEDWPAGFKAYLRPDELAGKQPFQKVLKDIVPKRISPATDLLEVMKWIDANMHYDHAQASLRADPLHAFTERRGHCSDYHGLCATMGRSLGYPTRVTYGLSLFPKNSPSHCKVEAYLPPYGWVSYDLSATQQLAKRIAGDRQRSPSERDRLAKAARLRLREGFRENSWLLLTKGTNYHLAPRASGPVTVVRTIYAEADGEPLPDPDPANIKKREFGWMTLHKYTSDKPFKLPFKDFSTLDESAE